MFRSVLRCAPSKASALSAASGAQYPAAIGTKLAALGFSSNLWLTEKQMKLMNVTVKPECVGKGFETESDKGNKYMLYNSMQTSNPAKVESMKGKLVAKSAFSGEKMYGDTCAALNQHMSAFSTNEWLSDKEISSLGMEVKAGAKPVEITINYRETTAGMTGSESVEERTITKVFYNVDDLANKEILGKLKKIYPISASTGKPYGASMAMPLARAAIANNFNSPFWTTLSGAQSMGLIVKDPSAGVELSVSPTKTMTFFNACQTDNPTKVATAAYKAQFQPRSAVSGTPYPEPTKSELSKAALDNKHRSVYWLTEKQAAFLGVDIMSGQMPTQVAMTDGVISVFNADQTTNKASIEARHRKK